MNADLTDLKTLGNAIDLSFFSDPCLSASSAAYFYWPIQVSGSTTTFVV